MQWPDLADSLLGTCMDVFGREVTYAPAGGSAFKLQGVFDAPHLAVGLRDGEVYYSTTDPKLGVRLSDFFSAPLQGDVVSIDGVDYQVIDVQPDGQGGATLDLHTT
jgi:hypothetical protein